MASQEGMLCMTLFVTHCNDFDSYIGGNFQSSYIDISFDESNVPCHDRGNCSVVLVLQNCSDSLHILPGSSSDANSTSGVVGNFSNIEFDEDVEVIEETFITLNEGVEKGIKQEEIPVDITFPDTKSEPDKVSYVFICLLLDTF